MKRDSFVSQKPGMPVFVHPLKNDFVFACMSAEQACEILGITLKDYNAYKEHKA